MADDTGVTRSRPGLACAFTFVLALCLALPSPSSAGEIIVRRDAGLSAGQRSDLRQDAGVKLERILPLPDSELVTVADANEQQALAALNADPGVRYAAANVPLRVAAFYPPTDTYFKQGLQKDLEQENDADIDAMSAWTHEGWEGPGKDVDVAVVDQQVWTGHRDLQGRINTALATDVLDGAGCDAPAPTGRADHGTHVAGTIVAAHNGVDIAGIAPDARVVPIRAFDNCGGSSLEIVLNAFRYAGEHEVPIVVASFATDPLNQTDSAGTDRAFSDVFKQYSNTLFIVAAGNEGSRNDENPVFPCETHGVDQIDPPNVICVAMTDRNDKPACTSNVGGSVDVFAPGELVPSTVMNRPTAAQASGVESLSGTSMSAAVVAGVAALALSAETDAPASLLKAILLGGTDSPDGLSAGRINAAKAVGEVGPGLGGPGGEWVTCDQDHDGVRDSSDKCVLVPGSFEGCPDTDGDGYHDGEDNCRTLANDQSDMDGDGVGDACDDDVDGDTLGETVDQCPRVAARTTNKSAHRSSRRRCSRRRRRRSA
jgi:major intracellular serine protease